MMRSLVLGTAGHIDHGKTALVRALTGVDTDRLAEEKRRGITIDLGFARFHATDHLEFAVVDVPGHEAFVRNMLAGASGVDLILLVVAADESVMPQTREHLAILDLLHVRAGVVAVTKADLVEPDWLALVVEEVKDELASSRLAGAPIVPVSAVTGDGLDALRHALETSAAHVPDRGHDDLFRMPIDRVFSVHGTGTVVTGTIWSGRVARDESVHLFPAGTPARVRAVQMHGGEAEEAIAGRRAALALVGVERHSLQRGDVAVGDGAWVASSMITVHMRVLPDASRPVRRRQRVRFHLGTAEVMARAVPLDGEFVEPGQEGWAQIRLEAPVLARAGDRFVIRAYSPVTTIGGGVVVEPAAPKRKRLNPNTMTLLRSILHGDAHDSVSARLAMAGWSGIAPDRLAIETPHPAPAAFNAFQQCVSGGAAVAGDVALPPDVWRSAIDQIVRATRAHHQQHPLRFGIERESLRRALPHEAPPRLADAVLAKLLDQGSLEMRGGLIALSEFEPRLTARQEQLRQHIARIYAEAGLRAPTIDDLPDEATASPDLWPLIKLLEAEGVLVQLGTELFMARDAFDRAAADVQRLLAGRDGLGPSDFRDVLPLSRKFLIPLLERFDQIGITRRLGELRAVPAKTAPVGPPSDTPSDNS